MIIDNAVNVEGRRAARPESREQTFESLGFVRWINFKRKQWP